MSRADELVAAVGLARAREIHAEVDAKLARAALDDARKHVSACQRQRQDAEHQLLRLTGHVLPWEDDPPPPFSFETEFAARIEGPLVTAPAH